MKSTFVALFTALFFLSLQQYVSAGSRVTVTAEAYGNSPTEAEKNALQKAVRMAIGEFVDAETYAQNGELINDEVLTYSDGFVESKKVLRGPEKDEDFGLFSVSIEAVVVSKKLVERLKESKISVSQLSGENLWAESVSKASNVSEGRALLHKFLNQEMLPERLVKAELISAGSNGEVHRKDLAKPDQKTNYDKNTVELTFHIELAYDLASFYEQAIPRLTMLLDNISSRVISSNASIQLARNHSSGPSYQSIINQAPVLKVTRDPFLHFSSSKGLYFSSWKDDTHANLQPEHTFLAVSQFTNANQDSHKFKIYELERSAYEEIIETCPARILPNLLIEFELEGSAVRSERVDLRDCFYLDKNKDISSTLSSLSISSDRNLWKKLGLKSGSKFLSGPITKTGRRDPFCYTVAPYLISRDLLFTKPVFLYKTEIAQEELKTLKKVSLKWLNSKEI
jgi:hypothetical protein